MKKSNTFSITLLALFIALIIVMDFTPLGYITTGLFSITLMTIPVALGAINISPLAGAILGGAFGLTSFLQCFGIGFFVDPSGTVLFSTSPIATVITCFVPRILAGLFTGLVFSLFKRKNIVSTLSFAISSACMPILNTALFMSCYVIMFKNTVLAGASIKAVFLSALSINLLIELAVTAILCPAISAVLYKFIKKTNKI